MTLQQLKYMITVAEKGSITEAAKTLYISQPSLSEAIKEVEKEAGITIFIRIRSGAVPTKEGMEFLGYARQVLEQMDILNSRYIDYGTAKQRFCVSTQHYTFTANAFVELVRKYGNEHYEFILNETQTHQIIEDVRNRFSDLGILFLSSENEGTLCRLFDEYSLNFIELFTAKPHVFISKEHPLAKNRSLTLEMLAPYPKLSFVQGVYESADFAEELFSNMPVEKSIMVSDRAAIVNLMLGLNGYTISSGILPTYLQADNIISIPIDSDEKMRIGYIKNKDKELSELGKTYINALMKFNPNILGLKK